MTLAPQLSCPIANFAKGSLEWLTLRKQAKPANAYSWLSRKAPSPLRSPGLPPSLITP